MNRLLAAWNEAEKAKARYDMIACCGAPRWAEEMVARRPFASIDELCATAEHLWGTMAESDWLVAFACHPRIGERKNEHATAQSAAWSRQEQSSAGTASEAVLTELTELNARYEERFGFTYIVCATGKSVDEMLAILRRRVASDRSVELHEAAEQQRQIMQIRLRKWLAE
jgi:2-oxo-4-hydroxy-4-carboxy-5-ureidoimidazoline decarboxylase